MDPEALDLGIPAGNRTAAQLALILWRRMDPAYKQLYRRTIWDQFESSLRGAARTSPTLRGWWETAKRRLAAGTPTTEEAAVVVDALAAGEDSAVLHALRAETALVVVQVRVLEQQRKEDEGWERQPASEATYRVAVTATTA